MCKIQRLLIIPLIIVIIVGCDNQRVETENYVSGGIKQEIYFKGNDTIKKYSFFENGNLKNMMTYVNNKFVRYMQFYNNGNVYVVRNVKDYRTFGISRIYSPLGNYSIETLFYNNQIIGGTNVDIKSDSIKYFKRFYYKTTDTTVKNTEGLVTYDKASNKILKDESFYYITKGKDTINDGEEYVFEVEILSLEYDSVAVEIVIGNLDTNLNFIDTIARDSGFKDKFVFAINPQKTRYNLLIGKIFFVWYDKTEKVIMTPDLLYFHDFYVREEGEIVPPIPNLLKTSEEQE